MGKNLSGDGRLDLASTSVALLANAASGRDDTAAQVEEIRAQLEPHVGSFRHYPLRKGSEIASVARQAVKDGAGLIATLGGDGTQSAVAGALAGSDTVMAVLPGGTFNYFSRGLGLGNDLSDALEALVAGHVAWIDLGEVNGRIFLNNASFGVYPDILERRESIYHRWGRSRLMAYWSVLASLLDLRHPMQLRVSASGETRDITTPLAFAARSPYQLDSLGLQGADAVRDGHFALFIAQGHRRRDMMTAALRLAFGHAREGVDFELIIADDIVISGGRARRLVAFDGEKTHMAGPWHLKVRKDHLRVIVPAPAAAAPDSQKNESQ